MRDPLVTAAPWAWLASTQRLDDASVTRPPPNHVEVYGITIVRAFDALNRKGAAVQAAEKKAKARRRQVLVDSGQTVLRLAARLKEQRTHDAPAAVAGRLGDGVAEEHSRHPTLSCRRPVKDVIMSTK